MTCKLFFCAICLETEVLMISQTELPIEVVVQFMYCTHIGMNFKLLASEVFFHPFPELKQFLGHQTDDSVGTTVNM